MHRNYEPAGPVTLDKCQSYQNIIIYMRTLKQCEIQLFVKMCSYTDGAELLT